jgi:hypothetical protein
VSTTRPAGALRSVLTKRGGRYRGSVGGRRSVLVNFVYCHPVGHAIEALHYCHGYHRADPGLRIGLALNADTPTELAALCPYVDDIYPVSVDVFDRAYDPAHLMSSRPAGIGWWVTLAASSRTSVRPFPAWPGTTIRRGIALRPAAALLPPRVRRRPPTRQAASSA